MKENEIREHWNRSLSALESSKILLQHQLYLDSVSRSYYAILHAARAALLVYDIVPKSHNHVRQSFGLYLVKSGDIEKHWSNILSIAYRDRVNADYMDVFHISDENAEKQFANAKDFIQRMNQFLSEKDIEI